MHHIEYHEDFRMNPVSKVKPVDSPAVQRLDDVRMSESNRATAKQQMRRAEYAADLLVALVRFFQSTAAQWNGRLSRRPTASQDGT